MIRFVKMHGIGNDYVYVDTFRERVDDPSSLAVAVADRHRGIGGDGLILIGPPTAGSGAAVRMRMFNADGSESEMCGNGVRCVAKYAIDHGLADDNPIRVQTGRGVLEIAWRRGPDGSVGDATVDMGEPILDAAAIPLDVAHAPSSKPSSGGPSSGASSGGVHRSIQVDGAELRIVPVSMGNPHAVAFVGALPDAEALRRIGPRIERHPAFPARVNMHFVRVESPTEVTMVTWERGSGPTLACGTGASAVCVAGVLAGVTERSLLAHLPGGDLQLQWRESDNHVLMTGAATEVFSGVWPGAWSGAGPGVGGVRPVAAASAHADSERSACD